MEIRRSRVQEPGKLLLWNGMTGRIVGKPRMKGRDLRRSENRAFSQVRVGSVQVPKALLSTCVARMYGQVGIGNAMGQ